MPRRLPVTNSKSLFLFYFKPENETSLNKRTKSFKDRKYLKYSSNIELFEQSLSHVQIPGRSTASVSLFCSKDIFSVKDHIAEVSSIGTKQGRKERRKRREGKKTGYMGVCGLCNADRAKGR